MPGRREWDRPEVQMGCPRAAQGLAGLYSLPVWPGSRVPTGAPALPVASVSASGKWADICIDLLTRVMPLCSR